MVIYSCKFCWQKTSAIPWHNNELLLALDTLGDMTQVETILFMLYHLRLPWQEGHHNCYKEFFKTFKMLIYSGIFCWQKYLWFHTTVMICYLPWITWVTWHTYKPSYLCCITQASWGKKGDDITARSFFEPFKDSFTLPKLFGKNIYKMVWLKPVPQIFV